MIFVKPVRRRVVGAPPGGQTVFDEFTNTDNTPLVDHTPNVDVVGGGWTDHTAASHVISGNRARSLLTDGSVRLASIDSGQSDCIIKVTDAFFARQAGGQLSSSLITRLTDAANHIVCGIWTFSTTPWTWAIWEIVNGSAGSSQTAQGVTGGFTNTSVDDIQVTCNANQVRMQIPSESIDLSLTSSHNQSAVRHGLRSVNNISGAGTIFDNFSVESLP